MAHCLLGAPLVVIDSNGALWTRCAISMYGKMEKIIIHTSGAPCLWCAISVEDTNDAPENRCATSDIFFSFLHTY